MNRLFETAGRTASALARITENNAVDFSVDGFGLKTKVERFIHLVRTALFPNIFSEVPVTPSRLQAFICVQVEEAGILLCELLSDVLRQSSDNTSLQESDIESVVETFLNDLPSIAELLRTDIRAAYLGDPAAKDVAEVLLAYPSFEAVSIFRLAHRLFELKVPMLPRMMTEYAHRITGIDIHPGATIGEFFFIDHGTGVVIGETTVIGHHVKLYQGVTLGAKSFSQDADGNPVKGIHRHPRIGNHVIIYSGATILGGDTCIGDNCVIGGNVWLTKSVPSNSKIYSGN